MLKPSESVIGSLALATVVYAVYQGALPPIADVRVGQNADADIEAAERMATWTSAGTVAIVSLLAKDPTLFTVGGLMTVALAWWYRHANAVNPLTGRASEAMGFARRGMMDENGTVEYSEAA